MRRPLTQGEKNEVRFLRPENWTGELGREYRDSQYRAAEARESHRRATTHKLHPFERRCEVCGVTELQIEAARYEGGIICLPDLIPADQQASRRTVGGDT